MVSQPKSSRLGLHAQQPESHLVTPADPPRATLCWRPIPFSRSQGSDLLQLLPVLNFPPKSTHRSGGNGITSDKETSPVQYIYSFITLVKFGAPGSCTPPVSEYLFPEIILTPSCSPRVQDGPQAATRRPDRTCQPWLPGFEPGELGRGAEGGGLKWAIRPVVQGGLELHFVTMSS
ncbi:hypothetical protein Vadar_012938 [Vaccinium darrowii]|uniref:Uncharacterized protein n=1 Tax=Vaccinium darrowii TaxID=229202 RepID=A0ACB7YV50_9ERIC|nr:hypothetical protein Vadar_012938 [Vaccinium darrowii]